MFNLKSIITRREKVKGKVGNRVKVGAKGGVRGGVKVREHDWGHG